MKIFKVCALLVSVACCYGMRASGMGSCSRGVQEELINLTCAAVVASCDAGNSRQALKEIYEGVRARLEKFAFPGNVEETLLPIIANAHKNAGVAVMRTPGFKALWAKMEKRKSPSLQVLVNDFKRILVAYLNVCIESDLELKMQLTYCQSLEELFSQGVLHHDHEEDGELIFAATSEPE